MNDKESLLDTLQHVLIVTTDVTEVKIGQVLSILSSKGSAAILILFSLPFCIPIQIPGFSTPFGILLAMLGIQMALGKLPWWPKWILEKKINSQMIEKVVHKTIHALQWVQKFIHPRLLVLTQKPLFQRLNGLLIFCFASILALPLPIPMTNLLFAFPILCMGIGLIENDGIFILIAYFLAIIYSAFLWGLFLLT